MPLIRLRALNSHPHLSSLILPSLLSSGWFPLLFHFPLNLPFPPISCYLCISPPSRCLRPLPPSLSTPCPTALSSFENYFHLKSTFHRGDLKKNPLRTHFPLSSLPTDVLIFLPTGALIFLFRAVQTNARYLRIRTRTLCDVGLFGKHIIFLHIHLIFLEWIHSTSYGGWEIYQLVLLYQSTT